MSVMGGCTCALRTVFLDVNFFTVGEGEELFFIPCDNEGKASVSFELLSAWQFKNGEYAGESMMTDGFFFSTSFFFELFTDFWYVF
jgi:hypothetical protein